MYFFFVLIEILLVFLLALLLNFIDSIFEHLFFFYSIIGPFLLTVDFYGFV